MPAHYAHYRFGCQVLPELPAELRRSVQRFRQLFDVGLHGPDPFFYYNILMPNPVYRLGKKYHAMTGCTFFRQACRRQRLEPTEGGQAYLYGLLAHYCLDSHCHPFVNAVAAEGNIGHTELETEFDRYLLTLDRKPNPHTFHCSHHMRLTKGEAATAARFFPPVTPAQMTRSVSNMAALVNWLASEGAAGAVLKAAVGISGDKFRPFLMTHGPNPTCSHLDTDLLALYNRALGSYPSMAHQLAAHLQHNAPLGESFHPAFG